MASYHNKHNLARTNFCWITREVITISSITLRKKWLLFDPDEFSTFVIFSVQVHLNSVQKEAQQLSSQKINIHKISFENVLIFQVEKTKPVIVAWIRTDDGATIWSHRLRSYWKTWRSTRTTWTLSYLWPVASSSVRLSGRTTSIDRARHTANRIKHRQLKPVELSTRRAIQIIFGLVDKWYVRNY